MSARKRKQRGFTLVEIMIVVSIIGLLAAIAIPNLLRARINSNEGMIKTELKAFSTATESYRSTQTPPSYPTAITDLTGANPAYLDATWDTAQRKSFDLSYTPAASPANSYSMLASPQSGSGITNHYCVDHTGIMVAGASVSSSSTGCAGGLPISA